MFLKSDSLSDNLLSIIGRRGCGDGCGSQSQGGENGDYPEADGEADSAGGSNS